MKLCQIYRYNLGNQRKWLGDNYDRNCELYMFQDYCSDLIYNFSIFVIYLNFNFYYIYIYIPKVIDGGIRQKKMGDSIDRITLQGLT